MEIKNVQVHGIENALVASGLPMHTDLENEPEISMKRCKTLGSARAGSGHDCFLKGINVTMTITAAVPFWGQWERYAFQDTISSTSQMHRLKAFDLQECFAPETPQESIDIVKKLQEKYNEEPTEENFRALLFSVPQGFLYTRAITTNYLQLKTMYLQRKNHKLKEWREFCQYLEGMPLFLELIEK